jgi:O-antigen ligase
MSQRRRQVVELGAKRGRYAVKWVALLLFLLAAPATAAWLRSRPRRAYLLWGALGFLPFVLGPWHLSVAPYATPLWDGYVKGWELSLLDGIALGILFSTRGRWFGTGMSTFFLLYIAAVVLAVNQAKFPQLAWSYPIQLGRAFLVFLAVARVTPDERGERAVFTGLVLGLVVQACYAIAAKAGGALQTGGSLGHQNLLGFVSHLPVMLAFAMFLAGRFTRIAFVGVIGGLTVVILTASRATVALSAVGLFLTLALSLAIHFSPRKLAVAVVGTLVLLAAYPAANYFLEQRLKAQGQTFFTEDKEREAFERAARAMIAANPWGVGPNHYVFVANTEGYSARAGVNWSTGSRSTSVHNSYLLINAETGYAGLITFLALLGYAIWQGLRTSIRFRSKQAAEVLLGVASGIVAMSLHGLFEWMFVVYPTQYVFAVGLGLIVGLRARFVSEAREVKRARATPSAKGQRNPPDVPVHHNGQPLRAPQNG